MFCTAAAAALVVTNREAGHHLAEHRDGGRELGAGIYHLYQYDTGTAHLVLSRQIIYLVINCKAIWGLEKQTLFLQMHPF